MQKLSAFTLMELLIGMIISSLVIAFGYSAYDLIYKQYLSYRLVKNKVLETMQFNTLMSNDFINAEYITSDENQIRFNATNKILTYNFMDSLIIRNDNEISDTFKLTAGNLKIKPVFNDRTNQDTLINNLQFNIYMFDDTERFIFTKNYTARTLMNYEIQNQQEK